MRTFKKIVLLSCCLLVFTQSFSMQADWKKCLVPAAVGLSALALYAGYKYVSTPKFQIEAPQEKLPIVFDHGYDIGFFGIEKLHPFDSKKYGKVAQSLKKELKQDFYTPKSEVSDEDLKKVHTPAYLESLNSSTNLAKITEIAPLALVPNFLLRWKLLKPMRLATQGTIDAAQLALKNSVGINLGGGYHHAKANGGGGFCVYADIPLAIKKLREQNSDLKIMYIDLDAHQGNGVASCLEDDEDTYIFDCYNEHNYPRDRDAAKRINKPMKSEAIYCEKCKPNSECRTRKPSPCQNCNNLYLNNLKTYIEEALQDFNKCYKKNPDIIFYNAGTDCFEHDVLGRMKLTKQGIVDRDQFIFEKAKEYNIPICMTLSGGYSQESAKIIADSIANLWKQKLLERSSEN